MRFCSLLALFLCSSAIACRRANPAVVRPDPGDGFDEALRRFRAYRLEPARIPPPSLERESEVVTVGDISGRIRLVRIEEADWNRWDDGGPKLFNNTVAHWFEIDVQSKRGDPLRWIPQRTRLELNAPGNVLEAAATQEDVLEELLFFAYQQERHLAVGDLVDRVRGSAPLRHAYLRDRGSRLQGLVAFPLPLGPGTDAFFGTTHPADFHVVSMRLTLAVETVRGPTELVWLLD